MPTDYLQCIYHFIKLKTEISDLDAKIGSYEKK